MNTARRRKGVGGARDRLSLEALPPACPDQLRLVKENILRIPFSCPVLNDDRIVDVMHLQRLTTNGTN